MIYLMPVKARVPVTSGSAIKPCGSELARDDGGTARITGTDPALSRASSLPPEGCWMAWHQLPGFPNGSKGAFYCTFAKSPFNATPAMIAPAWHS
jgi:hypothetical protein